MSLKPLNHVHIIGTGLMGTSIALAAKKADLKVTLEDNSASNFNLAQALGAGEVVSNSDSVDLVVVCVAPADTAKTVATAIQRFDSATVTEITSVKQPVFSELAEMKVDLANFVSSHPMTGSEKSGPWSADAEIFIGKPWLVISGAADLPVRRIAELVEAVGSSIEYLNVQEHDSLIAKVSHLPQLLATILAQQVEQPELKLSGRGFQDMTRLAGSDSKLWSEIIKSNKAHVLTALKLFQADLSKAIQIIETDPEKIQAILIEGKNASISTNSVSGPLTKIKAELVDGEGVLGDFLSSLRKLEFVRDLKVIDDHNSKRIVEILLPEGDISNLTQAISGSLVKWVN